MKNKKNVLEEIKAGIYLNSSRLGVVYNEKIVYQQESQLTSYIEELGEEHSLQSFVEIYKERERNVSIQEGPEFKRMMADIEKGKINTLLVYKLDHITRSLKDLVELRSAFAEYRLRLVSYIDSLDSATPSGEFNLNLLVSLAELESKWYGGGSSYE